MVTEKFTLQTFTCNYTIFAAASNDKSGFTYFQTICAPLADAVYIAMHGKTSYDIMSDQKNLLIIEPPCRKVTQATLK